MKKLVLFGMIALLSACDNNRSEAEEAVRSKLKDPDSAKFGEFSYNAETQKACLTVNAKNSMGGYTGDQQAFLNKSDGKWVAYNIQEDTFGICPEARDKKD